MGLRVFSGKPLLVPDKVFWPRQVISESCKPANIVTITEAIADFNFTGKSKLIPVCPVKGNGAINIILGHILYFYLKVNI